MSDVDGGAVAPAEGGPAPIATADPGVQTPKPISAEPIAAPEPKAEPEPKKPEPTPRDALRRAAEKVAEGQKGQPDEAPAKPDAPKPDAAPPVKAEGPSRDEAGKFAGKEPVAPKPDQPDTGAQAQKPTEKPASSDLSKPAFDASAKASFTASEAPARFSAAAKAEWATAPESVRAEAERAIKELTAGHEKYRADAEEFGKLREFHEAAKANGRDLHAALTDMSRLEDTFQRAPFEGYESVAARLGHGSFRQVAELYLGRTPDQTAAATEAATTQLRQRADHFERLAAQQAQELAGLRKEKDTVVADSLTRQIEEFKAGEGHERFEELRQTIGRLINTGMAEDLEDAYQMASALRPGPQNSARIAPAPTPAPPVAPAIDLTAQTQKGSKSIAGAPSPGSNPAARQTSSSIKDALRRAAAQAG